MNVQSDGSFEAAEAIPTGEYDLVFSLTNKWGKHRVSVPAAPMASVGEFDLGEVPITEMKYGLLVPLARGFPPRQKRRPHCSSLRCFRRPQISLNRTFSLARQAAAHSESGFRHQRGGERQLLAWDAPMKRDGQRLQRLQRLSRADFTVDTWPAIH